MISLKPELQTKPVEFSRSF